MTRQPRTQLGFSLVAAIFLLVVLAGLGIYMVTISTVQQQTLSYTFLSARAYQAARSGIEWGTYRVINDSDCSSFPHTIDFSDDSLTGFQTKLNCSVVEHQEKNHKFNIYNLIATSETDTASFGTLDYVSREIKVTITDAVP